MFQLEGAGLLLLTAAVWGVTNPLIKRGSKGIEKVEASSWPRRFAKEMWFLVCRPQVRGFYGGVWVLNCTVCQYTIPFLLNMSGSVLFVACLTYTGTVLPGPTLDVGLLLTFLRLLRYDACSSGC
jgi:hypothetical protein